MHGGVRWIKSEDSNTLKAKDRGVKDSESREVYVDN